ncbi:acetyl-CoA C-acyltransferase [Kibdelosporangium phytohabitans]|uniref:Acetyl-CoA acetyltransferase n=1 Tax=Kibdelosporangium phytohabitans TaxID=860235 RepID=A0A0N9HYV0_9PSEU|nr:acetyl-CoA C-acyltransferase [Kibdelosporangium phytohabitans]ALG10778.1 acetyl-CoA acetyltransferase [Kibdelosporangium phytohabitans]MBE1461938.1 acetyl-CoA C-acetyltransferase [Kibdelosporangium phytohabitans]
MTDAYVLDYVRTPRGKGSAKGAMHGVSPLAALVLLENALVERTGLDPARVEDVTIGNSAQVGDQGANIARTSVLLAGWGDGVPGVTVNRFCASGADAVAQTAARIRGGDLGLAVAGGVESVSRVPMFADGGPLWSDPDVVRRAGSVHMGIAADLNATVDGFTRGQIDAYGVETQAKAVRAWHEGFFDRSVIPVDGFAHDELVRPGTTMETLAALPPAFAGLGASGQDAIALAAHPEVGEIQHRHTVGTSPALADAAALLLLGSAAASQRLGLPVRARVVASATTSTDPVIMLTAGQSAVERVLARAGLRAGDIDVFEFAEAFGALCLRFRRDLGAGPERMNPNGGTIAMGHAFGATGAILVGQCIDELERRDGRYGVAAVSAAAGLGVAVLLERVRP